jgi:hypothetical protein
MPSGGEGYRCPANMVQWPQIVIHLRLGLFTRTNVPDACARVEDIQKMRPYAKPHSGTAMLIGLPGFQNAP